MLPLHTSGCQSLVSRLHGHSELLVVSGHVPRVVRVAPETRLSDWHCVEQQEC